jgi:hypothetical protein
MFANALPLQPSNRRTCNNNNNSTIHRLTDGYSATVEPVRMHPKIGPKAYDAAEAWSYEILQNHDVVFNPLRLEQAVTQQAFQIGFPASVCPLAKILCCHCYNPRH